MEDSGLNKRYNG